MLIASLWSAGCSGGATDLWDDYLSRLARLTDQPIPESEPIPLQRYPRSRELRQPVPELRTGLGRFISLGRCDMMALVSERNAILSRVQADSLRLDYELRFIHLGQQCLLSGELDDHPDQAQWLRDILASKQGALPALLWNASLASEEMAGLFNLASAAPRDGNVAGSQAAYRSLDGMRRLAQQLHDGQTPANAGHLEGDIQRLAGNRAGGEILHGMALATDRLDRAASMLEAADTHRLCPHGRPGDQARYLNNVFDLVVIGKLQPWLSDLWRDMDQLSSSLLALREAQPLQNAPLDTWLDAYFAGDDSLRQQLGKSIRRHSQAWQSLLEACDMAPARR